MKAIGNIHNLHPLDSKNTKKITDFLNTVIINEECSNFTKIIKSGDEKSFEIALSFNPKITTEEVRLANEYYPDIKINESSAAKSKWVDTSSRVNDFGLVR